MLFGFFSQRRRKAQIAATYYKLMLAARAPALYTRFSVADSFEGRFEALSLFSALLLKRLQNLPAPADDLAQGLVDRLFDGLDEAVRARGVGDVSVGKKVKFLGRNFYGRIESYQAALDDKADPDAFRAALSRNLYGWADIAAEKDAPQEVAPDNAAQQVAIPALPALPAAELLVLEGYLRDEYTRLGQLSLNDLLKNERMFHAPPEAIFDPQTNNQAKSQTEKSLETTKS